MSYISNKLTHWAGGQKSSDKQYEILTKLILSPKKLKFNSCNWNFCTRRGGRIGYKIPMICFTDIPFSEVENHCKKYSTFGISFDKTYLANCHASPVGYVQNPNIHNYYIYIEFALKLLQPVLNQKDIVSWGGKNNNYSINEILSRFEYIMALKEDYSKKEFLYNENNPIPQNNQETFFEDVDALYFEREWRIILNDKNLPWIENIEKDSYFNFDEKFVGPIIMPRKYIESFKREQSKVFENYNKAYFPSVLAYEDLKYI